MGDGDSYPSTTHVAEVGDGSLKLPHLKMGNWWPGATLPKNAGDFATVIFY
jgi:hypothetical protein